MSTQVSPILLRKINERRVLEMIQSHGPQSRADVRRAAGMSAPTVSKAVASLLEHGLLEEREDLDPGIGRPAKLLHLAHETAGVMGIVIDRQTGKAVFMASAAGGMEIEEVAAKDPSAILKEYIIPGIGLQAFQARKLAFGLGLGGELINDAAQFMVALYRAFEDTDASLAEINPFLITGDNKRLAAKRLALVCGEVHRMAALGKRQHHRLEVAVVRVMRREKQNLHDASTSSARP